MEEYTGIGNFFNEASDPRSSRNKSYKRATLMGTSLLAMLSGVDSLSGIQNYVECHARKIGDYFDLSKGIASHDTYQRFWDGINPTEFLNSFHLLTSTLTTVSSDMINIDI